MYVFQYVRTLTLHSYGWATETTPLHACHILPLLFWCQNAAKGHLWDSYRCAMIISFESKSSFPFLLFWPFAPLLMEQLMVHPHQYVLYCKNFVALVCHTMKTLYWSVLVNAKTQCLPVYHTVKTLCWSVLVYHTWYCENLGPLFADLSYFESLVPVFPSMPYWEKCVPIFTDILYCKTLVPVCTGIPVVTCTCTSQYAILWKIWTSLYWYTILKKTCSSLYWYTNSDMHWYQSLQVYW